jgi:hypothetical protein
MAPVTADVPLRCIPTTIIHGPLGRFPDSGGSFEPCTWPSVPALSGQQHQHTTF